MRRATTAIVGMIAGSLFLLAGCQKNDNPTDAGISGLTTDQQAIQDIIASDSLFTSDAVSLNDGSATLAKSATAILPGNWGRDIDFNSVNRTVTFQTVDDSTVIATMKTLFSGTVWIRAKYALTDTARTTIAKPFSESVTRFVRFVKVAKTNVPRLNWRMREISVAQGGTTNAAVTINQVRFFMGTDTLTIADPANYWFRTGMPGGHQMPVFSQTFMQGFRMEVTVTSTSPDSDIVSIHRPYWALGRWQYRAPMALVSQTDNGDGTFTRVYACSWSGIRIGRHHIFVGVLTRASIFDDQAPFSSHYWGIPFIVQ